MATLSALGGRILGRTVIVLALGIGPALAQQSYGPVRAGEGVYAVVRHAVGADTELNLRQWALAIFAANRESFGAGPDQLRVGTRLEIPTPAQAAELWHLGKQLEEGAAYATVGQAVAAIMHPRSMVLAPMVPESIGPAGSVADGRESPPHVVAAEPAPGKNPWDPPAPYFSWQVEDAPPETAEDAPEPVAEPEDIAADTPSPEPAAADVAQLPAPDDTAGAFADTQLYQRAQAAVGGPNAAGLVAELREVENIYAGEVEFDYLYGVLLLDAGQPQEALYPLLRAYQQRPDALGIRLDLGRAYFESGENETARVIFRELAAQDPPPQAALVIDSYLDASERLAGRYERRVATRLAFASGFDSNANSASSLNEFAGFILDDASRSTESGYALLRAESEMSSPLGPRLSWQLGGNAQTQQYADASEFSNTRWGLATGLDFRRGGWRLNTLLTGGQSFVDGQENHAYAALTPTLVLRATQYVDLRLSAKYGALRYADELSVRDVDQLLASAGASRRFNFAFGGELGVDVALGQDEAVETGSPFGRDLVGASVRGAVQLRPAVRLVFATHYLDAEYDGSFVGLTRQDEQLFTDFVIQLTHNRWQNWTAELLTRYVDNRSTVELYDYDRLDVGLGLKWLLD